MSLDKDNITIEEAERFGLISKTITPKTKQAEKGRLNNMRTGAVMIMKIYDETKGKCRYCGKKLNYDDFTLDHIIPIAKGGKTVQDNLTICCQTCNSLKADRDIQEFTKELKDLNKRLTTKFKTKK